MAAVLWNPSHCIPPSPSRCIPCTWSIFLSQYLSLNIPPPGYLGRYWGTQLILSQEQSVPSAHWLPFHPTRSAARSIPQHWSSARDSWRAGISVRRWGRAYHVISHQNYTNPWSCCTIPSHKKCCSIYSSTLIICKRLMTCWDLCQKVGQGLSCDFSPKLYQSMKLLYNSLPQEVLLDLFLNIDHLQETHDVLGSLSEGGAGLIMWFLTETIPIHEAAVQWSVYLQFNGFYCRCP